MTRIDWILRLSAGLALVGLLTACAEPPVEQCEPGVGEISDMGTVTPPGC